MDHDLVFPIALFVISAALIALVAQQLDTIRLDRAEWTCTKPAINQPRGQAGDSMPAEPARMACEQWSRRP